MGDVIGIEGTASPKPRFGDAGPDGAASGPKPRVGFADAGPDGAASGPKPRVGFADTMGFPEPDSPQAVLELAQTLTERLATVRVAAHHADTVRLARAMALNVVDLLEGVARR